MLSVWYPANGTIKQMKKRVVALLRSDRDPSRQQVLERPEMISQPQSHRRGAVVIAIDALLQR